MPTIGSLFAGIGGFDLGFERHGFETKWQVEIDPACQRVLRERFPHASRFGDITTVDPSELEPVDVITFGSPCQDLSVAGQRAGLAGGRSSLFYEATRIIRHLRPRFAIWENVPGAFSSNEGRDFAAVLAALADCGALDIAWRVLDAQWFGVAQRRRRVFVVADFGGECASEILALAESLRGDSPPRRTAGQGTAPGTEGGAGVRGWQCNGTNIGELGTLRAGNGHLTGGVPFVTEVIPILEATARQGQAHGSHHGVGDPGDPMYTLQSSKQHGVFIPDVSGGHRQDLDTGGVHVAFGISENQRAEVLLSDVSRSVTSGGGKPGQGYPAVLAFAHDVAPVLTSNYGKQPDNSDTGAGPNIIAIGMTVRRLTPRECERLQGFPDDWTLLDPPQSDSARYRQLGNAVAVPVAAWIGKRVMEALP